MSDKDDTAEFSMTDYIRHEVASAMTPLIQHTDYVATVVMRSLKGNGDVVVSMESSPDGMEAARAAIAELLRQKLEGG